MRDTRIENARIKDTMLGVEDHGILTAYVHLEGDGWGVGFGGYAMDSWDQSKKRRLGTAFGTEYILRLLDVIGVSKWEDLKGKYCRVETEGLGGGARRIGHITKDKWFDPKALAEEFKDEAVKA